MIGETGFPNQIFNDSWVVGFWRADHGGHEVEVGRGAWTLAQAIPGLFGAQGAAAGGGACVLFFSRDVLARVIARASSRWRRGWHRASMTSCTISLLMAFGMQRH